MKLPDNFDSWNPAMRGAYKKGAAAALFKPIGVIDGVKIFKPTHWTAYA